MEQMKCKRENLIIQIIDAFENFTLEDGICIWESRTLDYRIQDLSEYYRLKAKDERDDWRKIPIIDLYKCNSSVSFLDAKGMLFHLGLYVLYIFKSAANFY